MTVRIDTAAGGSSAVSAISARLGDGGTVETAAVPMLGDLMTGLDRLTSGEGFDEVPTPPDGTMPPSRRFSQLQSARGPLEDARVGARGVQRQALETCQSVLERYLDMKESALMRAEFRR